MGRHHIKQELQREFAARDSCSPPSHAKHAGVHLTDFRGDHGPRDVRIASGCGS